MEIRMRRLVGSLALVVAVTATAQAQDCGPVHVPGTTCMVVDLRLMSAAMGYMSGNINGLGATPNRVMSGAYFRYDIHVASLLLQSVKAIRTYDALYIEAGLGSMSSKPLSD